MADIENERGEVLDYEIIASSFENRYRANDERSAFYKAFLPAGFVVHLVTKANVIKTLENQNSFSPDEINRLWTYIEGHAPKVFLILAYMNLVRHIGQFKTSGFKDKDLPVVLSTHDPTILKSLGGNTFVQLKDVRAVKREDFTDNQWMFLAPDFRIDTFTHQEYEQGQLFPYVHPKFAVIPPAGGFGQVRKVVLHKDHRKGLSPYYNELGDEFTVALKLLTDTPSTDVEKFYAKEWTTLQTMADIGHDHLIKAISAYRRGQDKYFLFPWAQGGSLRDLWITQSSTTKENVILWALEQMVGLTEGITKLHKRKVRHGDIKPENILFFSTKETGSRFSGPLVVADVGLAKFHAEYTKDRKERTTTNYRTVCYEPPELTTHPNDPVSHKYDLWSLGCVFLEFLIWIRYDNSHLKTFTKQLSPVGGDRRFWRRTTTATAEVHPTVMKWIAKDLKDSGPHDLIVSKLADLIASCLLVIQVEDRNSEAFLLEMQNIQRRYRSSSQDVGSNRNRKDTFASPPDTDRFPSNAANHSNQNTAKLNDHWKNVTDEKLARSILNGLNWASLRPMSETQTLCSSCSSIDFQLPEINLDLEVTDMEQRRNDCALCNLLFKSISEINDQLSGPVTLFRDDEFHTLRLGRRGPPVLSLYSDPEYSPDTPPYAQIGLPVLPAVESDAFYTLINTWIKLCNDSHKCVPRKGDGRHQGGMPTRVVYVGDSKLRLVETNENMAEPYAALSHCWGKLSDKEKVTLKSGNIIDFKESIPYSTLPKNFQDAVRVTRAIGVSYLWIDSLCIIQDNGKDWEREASRMEHVFSSAYCTIAATSATSSLQGFLGQRTPRACVTVNTLAGPLYLAPVIDNFKHHVEEAVLNSRGWVLQERALSRRTIHFSSTQMYWECGDGVHCETLAQLRNPQTQILGDADFPNSGLQYYKDERIHLVQHLYQVYCALGLTNAMDRPKAILGLETRLGRVFKSIATYGIIWKFFERTILWRPAVPASLLRIAYLKDAQVPTWSWMAYNGNIKFIDIPFGYVTWIPNITNPFEDVSMKGAWDGSLIAKANKLNLDGRELGQGLILDVEGCSYDSNTWKSVILGQGTVKSDQSGEFPYYVILIRCVSSGQDYDDYERIGVGVLEQSHFFSDFITVRII